MQQGEVIAGRFEIEALAGTGGMADVYRALDRTSGVRVALKLLRATGPDDLARLAREAQALARLAHPGIVHYVAHGTSEGSEAFVAMEWVEGVTLSNRLRGGPLTLRETLQLGRGLASALAHAHEHGIIHRDVKPANVVLRAGEIIDPILLDFGVARTGLAVGLTHLGTIIGTPRYMAPEQARGGHAVDSRADVFALGAVMFKCLTGRAPFDGDDAIAVLAHLLFDDAPDPCAIVPNVPRVVGDVLLRMLAKEPEGRYPDGAAVVRAIDALDVGDITMSIAAPAPSGLTLQERRLLSLMVLTGKVDANVARTVAQGFGGRTEPLADGSVVVFVAGRDNASDLARVSARCALALRRALPEAPIVLATGRGDDVARDEDETQATNKTATSSRYSGVFERAATLLRLDERTGSSKDRGPLPIVIDDTTAGLLGADFDVGRTVGADVHALRGAASSHARYTLLGKPTPFVGRTRELASLLATWDDVCEQEVGRAVLVTAEAGLGKSRLLHEMFRALDEHTPPARKLRAKADATTAGSPFAALGAAIRQELGIVDEDRPDDRWHKLAAHVGSVAPGGETHVAEFVAEVAGVYVPEPGEQVDAARRDPRLMGDRIRRAWRAWIEGEASRGPVLIVLEDFQWGDLPTVKLLDEMFQDLPERPIFVLALARPEIDATFPGMWSRVVERMPLSALSRKAASSFVSSVLPSASAQVTERIVSLAAGNALHLEELVRAASEGKTDAPESLLAMLSAQVELLPDAERRVMRAASVLGSKFSVESLSALIDGTQAPNERVIAEVRGLVDSLVRREMLAGHQGELEIRNSLVRDVTYQMLTDNDRRLGHSLAADWLERGGAPMVDPFVLAEHRARGGQHAQAVVAYARSARMALDASDFAIVLDRVARAKTNGAAGEELAVLELMVAEARRWRGETHESAAAAKRAADLATPNTALYYRALKPALFAASVIGEIGELARMSEILIAAAPSDDALVDWGLAVGQASTALIVIGHLKENEALVERLEQLPEERVARSPELVETVRTCKGLRAYGRGDFTTLAEVQYASAEAKKALGDARGSILASANAAFALTWLGRYEEALTVFEQSRIDAQAHRMTLIELNALQNMAYVALCTGDVERAAQSSREVITKGSVEGPRLLALAHICLSRALLRGDIGEAEREARTAVEQAPTDVIRMYSRAALADVLHASGHLEEARTTTAEAIALLDKLPTVAVGDLYALVVCGEVLDAAGDSSGAREVVTRAQQMFESRRAFLRDDDARATFDTRSPEAPRLRALRSRVLADGGPHES